MGGMKKVELSGLAVNHLWCSAYHMVELFKLMLPEEDNHVTLAVAASAMSKVLTELDPDMNWDLWASEVEDEKK